jgi:hypothetical protein
MTPLQRARGARGWSQARVADELRDLAWQLGHGELGIDANSVSRHERGVIRRPRDPLPELYARLYETPVEALWPEGEASGTLAPQAGARRQSVRRRDFTRLAGSLAVGLTACDLVAGDPVRFAERARGATARWRADEQHRGASELLGPVQRHLRHLERHADHPVVAATASEAASFAAWLFADADNQAAARGCYHTAIRLARRSGDGALVAYQLGSLSQLAADTGHGVGASRLAQEAAGHVGRDAPAVAHAWIAATQAVASATVRDLRGSLAALDRAEALAGSGPSWPWMTPFDPAKVAGYRGRCELRLGRPEAVDSLTIALAGSPSATKQRAALLVDLAAAARRGDVEEACRLLAEAHTIAVDKKSEKTARRVLAARRLLDPKARAVRQLDQQLLAGWL